MSNLLDTELQGRAALLHGNAAALTRQERDVARATDALRKENDKLAKVARDAGRRIKELGNVQNWAEVLERDFLVLEETVRLVGQGDSDGESGGGHGDGDSCSCSECWSGSESGSGSGSGSGSEDEDGRGERAMAENGDGEAKSNGASMVGVGDGVLKSKVQVELSNDIMESLSEAMATEAFFKAVETVPQDATSPVPPSAKENESVVVDKGKGPARETENDNGTKTGLHNNDTKPTNEVEEAPKPDSAQAGSSAGVAGDDNKPDGQN